MTTIEKIDQEIIRCKDEMYDIGLYMADANINTTTFKTLENKCVQIMHVGPYTAEPETIRKMKSFMKENDLGENGLHHEIYISDPRKTVPEKMKTILRQPIK